MAATFVFVDIWILILKRTVKQMDIYPIKKDSHILTNLRFGEILNKLHSRDDNTKMMTRSEDNVNIEENQ